MAKRHRYDDEYSSDYSEAANSDSDDEFTVGPSKASKSPKVGQELPSRGVGCTANAFIIHTHPTQKKARQSNPKTKAPSTKAEVTIRATDTPLDASDSKKRRSSAILRLRSMVLIYKQLRRSTPPLLEG